MTEATASTSKWRGVNVDSQQRKQFFKWTKQKKEQPEQPVSTDSNTPEISPRYSAKSHMTKNPIVDHQAEYAAKIPL